jgi:hypothetical protein
MEALSQLVEMPDHPVWKELESYFRVRIGQNEKQKIVMAIQHLMTEDPNIDLNELTLQVTYSVLKKRR